jgi:hypothetical protein
MLYRRWYMNAAPTEGSSMNAQPLTVEVVTIADLCVGDLWRKDYGDTKFREVLAVRREHGCGLTYAVIEYSTATGRGEGRFKLDLPAERRYVRPEREPQTGDARAEIDGNLRGRLDELHNLQRLANPGVDLDEWSNDELLALDIGYGQPGPLEREEIQEQAEDRLDEYPLSVETTTVFEVVLGTGGPDDRLIFECSTYPRAGQAEGDRPYVIYEIDRVLYRYSWTGSAERVLSGEDRETAEELARRVVPELVE